MKKEIKLYKVEFNQYTNYMYDTVSNHDDKKTSYIHIPLGGLVIREDEFDIYKEYGYGFKELTFVGSMLEEAQV